MQQVFDLSKLNYLVLKYNSSKGILQSLRSVSIKGGKWLLVLQSRRAVRTLRLMRAIRRSHMFRNYLQ